MENTNDILLQKLDEFIRKYYKNQLYRGLIYSGALLLSLLLLALLLEYLGNFGIGVRTAIFWIFIILVLCVLGFYVAVPLLKMQKLGKLISYKEAAQIIGKHFPEIDDKLLNVLQLKQLSNTSDSQLLQAGIEQKTLQLRPIPFFKAIDFSKNKKHLKYIVPPAFILLVLSIVVPSFILDSSERLLKHSTYYEKPAPFGFQIQNSRLEAVQQEDFRLEVKITGDQLPNEVFIDIDGVSYKMKKETKLLFSYEFKNIQKNLNFQLYAADVKSPVYLLTALPKPTLIDFQVQLNYPAYTGKSSETLSNTGDIAVPKGSTVKWNFQTRDVDTLVFAINGVAQHLVPDANGRLSVSYRIMNNASYSFLTFNKYIKDVDSLKFAITSIEDEYPQIAVLEQRDSLLPQRIFFKGMIKDDYGFSKLQFKIAKTNKENPLQGAVNVVDINIKPNERGQEFYYFTDLSLLQMAPGDEVEYYFQLWDNDGVNGAKMVQSQTFQVKIPNLKEIDQNTEQSVKAIQEKAAASMSEIKKMQKEINDLLKKMVDKKDMNWQDKKQLEELAQKEQQLKQAVEDMQQKLEQSNRLEEQYKQLDPSILEKQKELEKLFKDLMNEDLKELFKEVDKLLQQKMDKDKLRESLENIKKNNENIEKQLDRDIELMKRLDVEKKLDDAIQKTQELSKKQKELAEQSKQKDIPLENLKKEQDKLNQEFQDIKKQLDEVEKKNTQLESPNEMKRNQNLEKEVEKKQQEASQSLDKKQKQDAQKKQEEAADKLEEMANDLEDMRSDMQSEQLAEDADEIRQLLKNLLTISFEQEKLMAKVGDVYVQDPVYQDIIKGQSKLKDDFKTVEDSLRALSKRQMEVSSVVNKEIASINSQLSKTMYNLLLLNQGIYGRAKNTNARTSQQYVMTSVNNLSLILAESLDKMQNQMRSDSQKKKNKSNNKNKGGSCDNPGSTGKPKPKSNPKPDAKTLRELQEQLNKQLQDMKNALEQKNKDGKKGHKIGEGSDMNREIARMAAEQERIRRMMQEYGEKLKQESGGNGNKALNDLLRDMEQTETDLVNKTISQQTLLRQQQILTRMLEHEKADKKQEQEEKRESKEGKDLFFGNQNQFLEYTKLKNKEIEMLRTAPPSFSLFYQQKVNEYFYKFENTK